MPLLLISNPGGVKIKAEKLSLCVRCTVSRVLVLHSGRTWVNSWLTWVISPVRQTLTYG